jgi:general secretion pathway protein L
MNAKELLNMDMETATRWLLHFWRWWTGELASMLPAGWRERLIRRSRITAEMKGGTLLYRNAETGQVIGAKPRGRVTFLMPSGQVLIREMELPLLPMSDVKRMLALDIDRLTPFQPEQVYFDADIVSRDQEAGRQQVALGVMRRDTATAILTDVQAHDLVPAAVGVKARDGGTAPSFDFLAAMRDAEGGGAAQKRSLYWWAGAAALLVFNFAILTWRDTSNLGQLREAVQSQAGPMKVALRIRERVDGEAARRAELLDAKEKLSPLPVLDAVTAAMPMDAWVRHFEWNGKTVHIIGARKTSQDILARIEASPYLRNAKSLSTDNRTDAQGYQPFEMTAEREFQPIKVAAIAPSPPPKPGVRPAAQSDTSTDDDDDDGTPAAPATSPKPNNLGAAMPGRPRPPPLGLGGPGMMAPGIRHPGIPGPAGPMGRPLPLPRRGPAAVPPPPANNGGAQNGQNDDGDDQ